MTVENHTNTFLCNVPDLDASSLASSFRPYKDPNNITYTDLLVLRTSGEKFAVWAEAYATNIQITCLARVLVDQHANGGEG